MTTPRIAVASIRPQTDMGTHRSPTAGRTAGTPAGRRPPPRIKLASSVPRRRHVTDRAGGVDQIWSRWPISAARPRALRRGLGRTTYATATASTDTSCCDPLFGASVALALADRPLRGLPSTNASSAPWPTLLNLMTYLGMAVSPGRAPRAFWSVGRNPLTVGTDRTASPAVGPRGRRARSRRPAARTPAPRSWPDQQSGRHLDRWAEEHRRRLGEVVESDCSGVTGAAIDVEDFP